ISIQGSQIFFTGKLQGTDDLKNAFIDVPNATSPYPVPPGTTIRFYRAAN
ncbi:MAG: hypothetical protein JNL10_05845, partial [Verrucomicrobiales bacterium]|nr:hypothetical protein [Verrucomicrobiales bacterium]